VVVADPTRGEHPTRRAVTLRAMLILAIIVIGLAAGWVAQLVLSRDTTNRGEALAAGLIGSFVGGLLGSLLAGDGLSIRPSGLIGTVLGAPVGVWVLEAFPPSLLKRLIGLILIAVVVIEWYGAYPEKLSGRHWGLCAGGLAGLLGGAIGTPGPPVILYAVAQGWSPRVMKAMLQTFFLVNQSVIVANHWWAGLLTREVVWLACLYMIPAAIGVAAGIRLFDRIDQVRFRRLMFALLFVLGCAMCVRG